MISTPEATRREPMPSENASQPICEMVMADLIARCAEGRRTYGDDLRAHNGRDAMADAYQEVLDLAMYFRQLIEERKAGTGPTMP